MQRGNYRLGNELDELAKLYLKEFPALDSKVKRKASPKLRSKNENKPINRESKQIKSEYPTIHGGGTCFDNKYSRQNIRYKQHRKIRNSRPTKHEEWNMEFEGTWEMDEDLVAEFLKSQNPLLDYEINNMNSKQQETFDDLFSFLPTFIFEDVNSIDLFHNKSKDEGYITSDSFYAVVENDNMPSNNNIKSKLDENVRKFWSDTNDIKTGLQSNNFIHRGTNLQQSIWSEEVDMSLHKFASLINSKLSDIEEKTIDQYESKKLSPMYQSNTKFLRSGELSTTPKKEICSKFNDTATTTTSTDAISSNSSDVLSLINHSESSSFVRVKASKKIKDRFSNKAVSKETNLQTSNENLLTSDLTHFRPIKETFIDGHTFRIAYTPKNINFERSESGSLYLNGVNYFEVNDDSNNNTSNDVLLLKFRKKQNEKASQTQEYEEIGVKKTKNNEKCDLVIKTTDMGLEYDNADTESRNIFRKESFNDRQYNNWSNYSSFHHSSAKSLSVKLSQKNASNNNNYYNILDNNYNIWSNNNENAKDIWNNCSSSCYKINSNSDIMKAELITEGEELMYDIQCLLNFDINATTAYMDDDESDEYDNSDNNNNIYLNLNKIIYELCINPEATKALSSMLDQILNLGGKENSLPQTNKIDNTIVSEGMFKKKLFQFKLDNEKRFIRKYLGIRRK